MPSCARLGLLVCLAASIAVGTACGAGGTDAPIDAAPPDAGVDAGGADAADVRDARPDQGTATDGALSDTGGPVVCGDGIRAPSEDCDDGNLRPGDGCDIFCKVQVGFACSAASPSVCAAIPRTNPASVIELSGGSRHVVIRKLDDSVWAWGVNSHGQIGDNTIMERDTPVQTHGAGDVDFFKAKSVVGGEVANFALLADQTVWSWGWSPADDLGNGAAPGAETHVPTPVVISTGPDVPLGSIVSLGGRGDHGLAVDSVGGVWSWGSNFKGQLGNNTKVDSPVAVHVLAGAGASAGGFLSKIVSVSGGGAHSIALDSTGHLWAWGLDFHGELGNGSFDVANTGLWTPVAVMRDATHAFDNVRQISVGWNASVAVRTDGTVWTWGLDTEGQLGNGNKTTNSNLPFQVSLKNGKPLTNMIAVAGGDFHAAALRSDGTVWAWGQNLIGQLGNGTFDDTAPDNLYPTQVHGPGNVGFLTNVIMLAAREGCNIAVQADGTVLTWGFGANGNLGNGGVASSAYPVQVTGLGPTP